MMVSLSDTAVSKIKQLIADKPDAGLRVKVVGGGCSGLQYRMEIDAAKERDKVFERDGAKLIVDKKSFLYLNGSQLDYAEELMSSGFRLVTRTPSAVADAESRSRYERSGEEELASLWPDARHVRGSRNRV
jgi:iron-sulfur cluster assembly accessory protein